MVDSEIAYEFIRDNIPVLLFIENGFVEEILVPSKDIPSTCITISDSDYDGYAIDEFRSIAIDDFGYIALPMNNLTEVGSFIR